MVREFSLRLWSFGRGENARRRQGFNNMDDSEYRCCRCLHVRTGTYLLGGWQIAVQVFILSMLVSLMINPNFYSCPEETDSKKEATLSALSMSTTPAPFTKSNLNIVKLDEDGSVITENEVSVDPDEISKRSSNSDANKNDAQKNMNDPLSIWFHNRRFTKKQDRFLEFVMSFITLFLAIMLVAGAIMERPSYIMPYFCVQLFDFIINCLTVVGYFSYLPDVKAWLSRHHWPAHMEHSRKMFLRMDDATLSFLLLVFCMAYLTIKAYLLGMVWNCYKYLVKKQNGQLRSTRSDVAAAVYGQEDEDLEALFTDPLLPPKYEDVLKTPANLYAPPPYYPGSFRDDQGQGSSSVTENQAEQRVNNNPVN